MTVKKWIYLILAIGITGYILFFYVSFNGNPLSKAIAKSYAIDYLEKHHAKQSFSIKDSGYNFKDKSYYFHYAVNEKNNQVYNYSIEIGHGWRPEEIVYHSLRYDSEDIKMSRTFTEAGTAHIQQLMNEAGLEGEAYYYVQVPLGYIDDTIEWTPKIELPIAADIHVSTDIQLECKKEFVQYVADVAEELHNIPYKKLYIESTLSEIVDGVRISPPVYRITLDYNEEPTSENVID